MIEQPLGILPHRYKPHYGLRVIENRRLLYGFDVFHQIASHGLSIDTLLDACVLNHIEIDWYNFIRAALKENWQLHTIIANVKTPIQDHYGVPYWKE